MISAFEASPVRLLDARFTDIDQMCSAVRDWNLDLRPISSSSCVAEAGRLIQVNCGPLFLGYARFLHSLDQFGEPPPGRWTFGVPDLTLKQLWWRGHDLQRDMIVVFPPGGELRSLSGPDFGIYTVSVDKESIARICAAYKLPMPEVPLRTEVFRPEKNDLELLRKILRQLLFGGEAHDISDFSQILETLVVSWICQSNQAKRRRPSLRVRDLAMRRCLERVESVDWSELSPAILCITAGVSERTLQYAFLDRFGITPAAFLKARRLGAVRDALRRADGSTKKVGDLAARYGFWHLGQFAADYRRMFGENPSDTLLRGRMPPVLASSG